MPVTINGDGSITGFVAQTANIANGAIGTNQLANGAATQAKRTYAAGEVCKLKNMHQHQWLLGVLDGRILD